MVARVRLCGIIARFEWRKRQLANIKSSKKDIVRSRQNRLRNSNWKSRIKTEVRKSRTALAASDAGAADLVKTASRLLDKAVTKA